MNFPYSSYNPELLSSRPTHSTQRAVISLTWMASTVGVSAQQWPFKLCWLLLQATAIPSGSSAQPSTLRLCIASIAEA